MTKPTPSKQAHRSYSRFRFVVWNALTLWLWPLVGLYTLSRLRGKKAKSPAWLRGAWGGVGNKVRAEVWIHAVSVGETQAARPLAGALRERLPACRITISSTTETGHQVAQALVRDGLCNAAIYFPVDVPFAIRRTLRRVQPRAIVLMETELWPNLLHLAHEYGANVVLANGRVSDNLYSTARRFVPVFRWMLSNVDACLMRSEFDAQRIQQLPTPRYFAARVQVVGDVKLERPAGATRDEAARQRWRETLGIAEDAPLWIAGSTHPGEEELILEAFTRLKAQFPALRLLIAPRHIERTEEVATLIASRGFQVVRRSEIKSVDNGVFLLNTVGELAELYAACEVAFVGGSLIVRGGHNLLEPVLTGVPVVFGPHVQNFREAAQVVREADLGSEVQDASTLAEAIGAWLRNKNGRTSISERADNALQAHRGAARRVAEVVASFVEANPDSVGKGAV